MSQRTADYDRYRALTGATIHLWVCRDCATLVPVPPGHTGWALCERHNK